MGFTALRRGQQVLYDQNLNRMLQELYAGMAITQAENVTFSTYGERVSVKDKAKNLTKFGTNETVGTSFETVAQFQGTVANETFVSTNIIDRMVSTSASDTQEITYEGHTIDGNGSLTFVVASVTLNGQTPVSLPTPVARLSRMIVGASGTFNSPQALPVGLIAGYVSSATTVTSGAVNTDSAVKCILNVGKAQSGKCSTSISSTDYYFITALEVGIGAAGGNAARVLILVESRDVANGGVWRPAGREVTLNIDQNGVQVSYDPLLIVPSNHDVRVRARTDSNTASVFAELDGVLAKVVS